MWALSACAPKPSEGFIKAAQDDYKVAEQALNEKIKQADEQIAKLQDPFAAVKSELGNVWAEKVEKDKALKAKIDSLSQKAQEVSTAISTAKNEASSALNEFKAFVDGLANQQKKDEELKADLDAQKTKITEKQGAIDAALAGVSNVQKEVDALSQDIKKKFKK
ncbi:MAG: hypothetical protein ABDH66_07610 [Bacteroidia bacterium]